MPSEQLAVATRVWPIADIVALTKPRITFMVLITTAGGLWLGQHFVTPHAVTPHAVTPHAVTPHAMPISAAIWGLTLLGTALIVGGANALNMVLERDTDALMRRTANRPLPAGRMPMRTALFVGVALSVASVPILAIGVNPTTALLAVLANLLYVLGYTPLKRRTHWALQVGAIPGAIPPLLGWTAATGKIELGGMALFGVLFAWQIAHFHAIALFRKADYARAGLVVMPNAEGDHATRHAIVRWAGVLFCFSVSLTPLGVTHGLYTVAAVLLGAAFLVICSTGLRAKATMKSARAAFFASLFYLVILFAALVVDGLIA